MADDPQARLLLIVTGSTLRAEEADRPLAYYLQQQIQARLEEIGSAIPPLKIVVIADFRWMHEDPLQELPTICLGGPGVNALAQRWLDELPVSLAVDNHYYIQMDPSLDEPRVGIWGMDNAETQIAVSVFLQRYLPRFLERCAAHVSSLPDPLDDDDDFDDTDL